MRNVAQNNKYSLNFTELRDICKEVYGIEYDAQMGEYANGTVLEVFEPEQQGYHTGLQAHGPKYENATWVEMTDEEAMDRFINQDRSEWRSWKRPFEKINDKGEYIYYQPELGLIIQDLIKRKEIPDGDYEIRIDW